MFKIFVRTVRQLHGGSTSNDSIKAAKKWVRDLSPQLLPKSHFRLTYSRSSGPGGQKVNKTSSKATLTLNNWRSAEWIPQEVKKQLMENGFRYATKSGDWVIQNDTDRSRVQNAELCFIKLCDEIKRSVVFAGEVSEEDKQKWKEIRKKTNEIRLKEKQMRSQKKQSRKRDWD